MQDKRSLLFLLGRAELTLVRDARFPVVYALTTSPCRVLCYQPRSQVHSPLPPLSLRETPLVAVSQWVLGTAVSKCVVWKVLLKIHLSSFEALSQWSTAFLAWYKHNTSLKITITDCLIDAPKILVWTCAWCLSSARYFKQEQDGKRLLTFEKFYSKHIIIWINAHMVHIRADQT